MHASVENRHRGLVANDALGSNARDVVLLVVYYLFAEDLGHSGGVFVRQKNEPCHTIIIIIINLFMIIMAPIFPKRPPIGVLF